MGEKTKPIKKSTLKKIVSTINIVTAIVVIGLSALSLIFVVIDAITSLKFFLIFSPVFMIGFGICMIAAECKIKFILKRLPFLKSLLGRGLSSVIYFFFEVVGQTVLAWASALALFITGIMYLGMHCGCGKRLEENNVLEDDDDDNYKEPLA